MARSATPFLAISLAIILGACVTAQPKKTGNPMEWKIAPEFSRQDERRDYQRIQSLYSKGDAKEALDRLERFKRSYPNSWREPEVQNLQGLVHLLNKDPRRSISYFQASISATQDSSFRQYVLYNLAAAQYEANQRTNALQTLEQISPFQLNPDTRTKYHYLKALIFFRKNKFKESAEELLIGGAIENAPQRNNHLYRKSFNSCLKKIDDVNYLDDLYSRYSSSFLADTLLYRRGMRAIREQAYGRAEGDFRNLIQDFPDTDLYHDVLEQLRLIQNQQVVDEQKIGLLLPMTGRFALFANRTLQGIELAFRIFNSNQPDSKVTLVIEDSGETPEQAVQALEKLYYDHKVVAVIGPLLSKGIDEVTQKAEDMGLPLISLAQRTGIQGAYIFHSVVTPKHQAYEIARYAIQQAGLQKFAILHPNDKFGQKYSEYFWDAVEELGGSIVGIESYPSNETDFRFPVDKLSGLFYKGARKREQDLLAKVRQEENVTRRTRKTEHYYKLPPIIDYDAVFIPDSAKIVAQILPTFAYRDVENVRFLGINTWNSPELIQRAKEYANHSLFVDSFFAQSQDTAVQRFVSRYESTFGTSPTAVEAFAYDAALLLEKILVLTRGQSSSVNRRELRDHLVQVKDFPGVTGRISFEEGRFDRKLKVLAIRGSKITEAGTF